MAGGLAIALHDALQEHGGVWFGWSGKTANRASPKPQVLENGSVVYATMDLSRKDHAQYYNGYANRTLWPLFHYRIDLTNFSRRNYAGYLRVNNLFARALIPLLKPKDLIWVHDYHLIPLAEILRRADVKQAIGFFLHTPFPSPEILVALPGHREIVRALCAYDVIGFQTINDLRAFQDYIRYHAGGKIVGKNKVDAYGRIFRAKVFPIGIDTNEYERIGASARTSALVQNTISHMKSHDMIIGVDRLDYSKGLIERFYAFQELLERYPTYRGKVTLLQIAPPSRYDVPEYVEIRHELEAESGHVNGRYANLEWVPINYINKSFKRQDLTALYRASRIGLVTPLRDGMNLVAKEYVAAQNPHDPGVLVLSRFAGAARELDAALIVNPFDVMEVAEAIAKGLDMRLADRIERWESMIEILRKNTLDYWRDSFLKELEKAA